MEELTIIGKCIGVPTRVCGRPVSDDDLEWIRTPLGIIGSCCMDRLLNPMPALSVPERVPKNIGYAKVRNFTRRASKQDGRS